MYLQDIKKKNGDTMYVPLQPRIMVGIAENNDGCNIEHQ